MICKVCNHNKPTEEFSKRNKGVCRACFFFEKKNLNNNEYFDNEKTKKILDLILNSKIRCINEISTILNIDLNKLIEFLSIVKINGEGYSTKVEYECEYCGSKVLTTIYKYTHSKHRFCNDKCMKGWQSVIWKGSKSPKYTSVEVKCDCCDKSFIQKKSAYDRCKSFHYCSEPCKRQHYAEVVSQTDEWRESNRLVALNNLKNGVYSTNTDIQIIINNLLNDLNIEYQNEFIINPFSLDIYLEEYNLSIEVNGDYWHCNRTIYDKIIYNTQTYRIKSDYMKNRMVGEILNHKILWLWEKDIKNNIELCKKLILLYINNKGELLNYNSFNYYLENDEIKLKSKKIIPYQDLSLKELKKYIELR